MEIKVKHKNEKQNTQTILCMVIWDLYKQTKIQTRKITINSTKIKGLNIATKTSMKYKNIRHGNIRLARPTSKNKTRREWADNSHENQPRIKNALQKKAETKFTQYYNKY